MNALEQNAQKGTAKRGIKSRWVLFRRDEDGGLIIFSIFIFILMLMAGGMAVDFMRFEAHRSVLQGTLDRAVLAAADIEQELDPALVVQDYFDKAMIRATLTDVQVVSGIGSRQVQASAQLTNPSIFLTLMGIDEISAPASSIAEERVPFVEISLVLDVSGSMADPVGADTRIGLLQDAATTFVNTVIPQPQTNSGAGLAVISIVPYNMSVNMGGRFSSEFNLTNEHNYSDCVLFDDADFTTVALDPTATYQRFAHYTFFWGYEDDPNFTNERTRIETPLCRRNAAGANSGTDINPVLPWQTDAGDLNTAIAALEALGGTAIDDGVRWGVGLLDPSMRPVLNQLVSTNDVNALAAGFPQDFAIATSSKVLVLMTDGRMDTEWYPPVEARDGMSNIFYDTISGEFSVLVRGTNAVRYAVTNQDDTASDQWLHVDNAADTTGNTNNLENQNYSLQTFPDTNVGGAWTWTGNNNSPLNTNGLVRLSWSDVYDIWEVSDLDRVFFDVMRANNLISNAEDEVFDEGVGGTDGRDFDYTNAERQTRMLALCTLAKDADILIYAIAVDSPDAAASQLLADCATSSSTFFDVAAADIEATFARIAGEVTDLRLTQ